MLSALGEPTHVIRNDQISISEIQDMSPQAIVLSPGPGRPEEAGIIMAVIKNFAGQIPIFGVCLGHQAIGQAFGGHVKRARVPKHGKQSLISHQQGGVFQGVRSPFSAARYHSLVVERETLPSCLEVTAETSDGLIMGLRHKTYAIEGVQFHPESIATEHGVQIMESFLRLRGVS
jgi:anthranilate synthase/aminodeoxychorismate synthase-like glutamine amidotransferase